jgi:ABC-type taurine transport system substrate-binding protein
MSYSKRGKNNPFDAYMAGFCIWLTPRQILLIDKICGLFTEDIPDEIDKEAFVDFKEQLSHEAKIKRKKYFGEYNE